MAFELFSDRSEGTRHTIIVVTSERSCCGRLNSEVLSAAKDAIEAYTKDSKYVRIISVGWKGSISLSIKYKQEIGFRLSDIGKPSLYLAYIVMLCAVDTSYDRCSIYFSKYYKMFEQAAA
jgi:F0F1-type ATP synthase gamma subunit